MIVVISGKKQKKVFIFIHSLEKKLSNDKPDKWKKRKFIKKLINISGGEEKKKIRNIFFSCVYKITTHTQYKEKKPRWICG